MVMAGSSEWLAKGQAGRGPPPLSLQAGAMQGTITAASPIHHLGSAQGLEGA